MKNHGESKRRGRDTIITLKGSQVPPACPSDKGSVKVKTLGWLLQAVTLDRSSGNFVL
jgi:hypothetical protein